jgi:hypothetical protein
MSSQEGEAVTVPAVWWCRRAVGAYRAPVRASAPSAQAIEFRVLLGGVRAGVPRAGWSHRTNRLAEPGLTRGQRPFPTELSPGSKRRSYCPSAGSYRVSPEQSV